MKPWKLVVDWTCHKFYGDDVEILLYVMDEDERRIAHFPSIPAAVDFAIRYFTGRGLDYDVPGLNDAQRLDSTRITLHPRPKTEETL